MVVVVVLRVSANWRWHNAGAPSSPSAINMLNTMLTTPGAKFTEQHSWHCKSIGLGSVEAKWKMDRIHSLLERFLVDSATQASVTRWKLLMTVLWTRSMLNPVALCCGAPATDSRFILTFPANLLAALIR